MNGYFTSVKSNSISRKNGAREGGTYAKLFRTRTSEIQQIQNPNLSPHTHTPSPWGYTVFQYIAVYATYFLAQILTHLILILLAIVTSHHVADILVL